MLLRLMLLARAVEELAEAEVAVADKGAHLELGGECSRVFVVILRLINAHRATIGDDVAEGPRGVRVMSSLPTVAAELDCTVGVDARLLQAACEEQPLAQPG